MVEHLLRLDAVFGSLSDPTRRDILQRISRRSMSVGEIAAHYRQSLAGVAKHLSVLEQAGLVKKTRRGKQQVVSIAPTALFEASGFLERFERLWENRLYNLDRYLQSNK